MDDKTTSEVKENNSSDIAPVVEAKELTFETKYNPIRGLEFKEVDGELYVKGLIATTHIDTVGDHIPKNVLDSWAKELNSGNPQSNKVSYHHAIKMKVAGICVKGSASVIPLPKGNFGLETTTKLNRTSPEFKEIEYEVKEGHLDGFSVEYNTHDSRTTHTENKEGQRVRVFHPETELHGYGFASRGINPNAVITDYSYKEILRGNKMNDAKQAEAAPAAESKEATKVAEMFNEHKEHINKTLNEIKESVKNASVESKALKNDSEKGSSIVYEVQEYKEVLAGKVSDVREQLRRAGKVAEMKGLISDSGFHWSPTGAKTEKEVKTNANFQVNGNKLEYKALGITTNQNTDTDYLQSAAELSDVYDPVIFNMLNQNIVLWNVLGKDNEAGKGNNQMQFTGKTASNASGGFYAGNAVSTGNTTRLKFQTKFKKYQIGVSVDGDMLVAARGGPVSDVFAKEIADATDDMMQALNQALYTANIGLETATGPISLSYLANTATNTSLYNLTRSATNKLSPDAAGDTYINGSSVRVGVQNLRAGRRQLQLEGAKDKNIIYVCHPLQADLWRGKFDDIQRRAGPQDTGIGFSTDLFLDGYPIFIDKDCGNADWYVLDLETLRIAVWQPPTITLLGITGDSLSAFIKTYYCVYSRAPRRIAMIYSNATS